MSLNRQCPIPGLVDDRNQVIDGKARVQRVTDDACPHCREVDLEMMRRVPGESRKPVADIEPERAQGS